VTVTKIIIMTSYNKPLDRMNNDYNASTSTSSGSRII